MPDDSVRTTLREIVERYDPIDDEIDLRRWRGLLRDLMGGNKLEVNLLIFAVEVGVPERIAAGAANLELALPRLASELEQTHGISTENADWSMATWAFALGCIRCSPNPNQDTNAKLSRLVGILRSGNRSVLN